MTSLIKDLSSIKDILSQIRARGNKDLELDTAIDGLSNLISEEEFQQRAVIDSQTKAVCTSCGVENAPLLIFRRKQGLYELLCKQPDGTGCYNNSARVLCQHVDHDTVSCTQLAEHEITTGPDNFQRFYSCSDHVGTFIGNATVYNVYPLDKGR